MHAVTGTYHFNSTTLNSKMKWLFLEKKERKTEKDCVLYAVCCVWSQRTKSFHWVLFVSSSKMLSFTMRMFIERPTDSTKWTHKFIHFIRSQDFKWFIIGSESRTIQNAINNEMRIEWRSLCQVRGNANIRLCITIVHANSEWSPKFSCRCDEWQM